jgi:hypothetical protein
VDWFRSCSIDRLSRLFLKSNIQGVQEYKKYIEQRLQNDIFHKEFEHEKKQLSPRRFQSLINKEVRSATRGLKNWVNQILDPNDPDYIPVIEKVTWFDSELSKLVVEPRRLIQGINKDMLDGSLLHFLPQFHPNPKLSF